MFCITDSSYSFNSQCLMSGSPTLRTEIRTALDTTDIIYLLENKDIETWCFIYWGKLCQRMEINSGDERYFPWSIPFFSYCFKMELMVTNTRVTVFLSIHNYANLS